jgi:hypothetical protein
MKIAAALIIALFALAGCQTDGSGTGATAGDGFENFSEDGQARCTKKGGLWVEDRGFFRCVRQTGEATKSCTSGRDCKGECLAASKTCSPFDPLLGCTEVLSDGGLLQKLCN